MEGWGWMVMVMKKKMLPEESRGWMNEQTNKRNKMSEGERRWVMKERKHNEKIVHKLIFFLVPRGNERQNGCWAVVWLFERWNHRKYERGDLWPDWVPHTVIYPLASKDVKHHHQTSMAVSNSPKAGLHSTQKEPSSILGNRTGPSLILASNRCSQK